MTLVIKELNTDNTLNVKPGQYLNRKTLQDSYSLVSSDSEDDEPYMNSVPTIVPMTPHKTVRNSMLLSSVSNRASGPSPSLSSPTPSQQPSSPNRTKRTTTAIVSTVNEPQTSKSSSSVDQATGSQHVATTSSTTTNDHNGMPNKTNSIVSCMSTLTEEFLTLQINQNDCGKSTYNVEISTNSNGTSSGGNHGNCGKQPEVFQDNDDVDGIGDDDQVPTSTLVRQFKHQTFHSESPKHVSYFSRQPYIGRSSSMLCSPNISPNKSKITKAKVF